MSRSLSGGAVREPANVSVNPLDGTINRAANSNLDNTSANPNATTHSIIVASAPPPMPPQAPIPPSPGGTQVWVPGHYTLLGNQWSWVNGTWTAPPTAGAVWVPGRYDSASRRWMEGHWDFSGARSATTPDRR